MKLQTKITLLFSGISILGLLLLNASIFYFVSEFNFEDFFKRLEARVNLAAEISINPDKESTAYKNVRQRYLEKLANETEYIVRLDTVKAGNYIPVLNPPKTFYDDIIAARGRKIRYTQKNVFYAGGLSKSQGQKYMVVVTATDPYGFKELEKLKRILLAIFLVSIILTWFAGKVFSYFTVRPVRNIIKSVQNISANNLHLRLENANAKDEIAELITTFNNMLTRLETAFETQNNFVSNASHELRTPLTIITAETELLLAHNQLPPRLQPQVASILTEAEKLADILASLLGLAQTGFDGKKQHWQKIRADELVIHVANSAKRIDPKSEIIIDFDALPTTESQLYTEGNANLLQLAISNIVLNACKYSNNQPVHIKICAANGYIIIKVKDKGIGIPADDQQHIFEPFFRASNTAQYTGHGVGLPLTLNIISLHKGSINIRSEEGVGTEIEISLPVVDALSGIS
ncbi:HAMP domain-containing histidine kinase [Mucilaginibacter pallidiroseus]|uniref:histidine kinase n=1 Tax=Mucilaginibacter pallidiroseus TaxID=2599295 RepID=A0A563U852_9SPHI|nr:HAMP domain-containing sensor histidine kinase [Mucilaginibacter pallidiroseus]TWR27508.1 HAMP domain-containing histidine kinase [Mucilaginibacter pallidiroseus]